MLSIFIILFLQFVSSKKNFPSIKFTKGGIFGWFDALALMKKPFNNKKMFGFRLNSTEPDLSMIIYDIANHLDLHDLNLSQRVNDILDEPEETETLSKSLLLSNEKCSERTGNSRQFCKLFGVDLNLESIGISENSANIFLGNLVGYLPTNLFFIILASLSIIYYVVQIVLQYKFFKPVEYSEPTIYSIVIFYAGNALIFISAIFFLCSFGGVNNFITTVISFDTVVPRITYSVSTSLLTLIDIEIPNGIHPIFVAVDRILNTTNKYLKNTIDSFIDPTSIFLQKMISDNESDPGVFHLYNQKIYPNANKFYDECKNYPNLKDIGRLFLSKDFSKEQKEFENLYSSELNLSAQLNQLDSIFVYFYLVAKSFENYFGNLSNMTLANENQTIFEALNETKEKSLDSYEFLTDFHKRTKKKNPLWIFLAIIFFFVGIFFMVVPVFLGLIFWMHNKVSRCVANTIAIVPLVMTILMFVLSFLMSGVGFALVAVSNQLEPRIDDLISNIIDITIPERVIPLGPINMSKQTNGNYDGILNLSSIVFPKPFNHFQSFVNHDEEDGIAKALEIEKIVNVEKLGDEIKDFLDNIVVNFNLPQGTIDSLNDVKSLLKGLESFPTKIDSLFNWFVPISSATKYLRNEITKKEPSALNSLDPYLKDIDVLTDQLNSQFEIGIQQLTQKLPEAINSISTVVPELIKSLLTDLSDSSKSLVSNIYPIINSIQSGMIIGPYALIRNLIFYDLASMCAYISASGTLMIPGFVIVVTLLWIRRKGMIYTTGRELGFFEFLMKCRKKKVANDHSCDSMETDDSNIIYMHDSDFDISTSYCDNAFEISHKFCQLKDLGPDEHDQWCIQDGDEPSFPASANDDQNNEWCPEIDNDGNYYPIDGYIPDPSDDCENWCLKEDQNGNYTPVSGYTCEPEDDNERFIIQPDQNGNYTPDNSYVCDPQDDIERFIIKPDQNGNYTPDNSYVCEPEDDNENFIVRLNRDGTIYRNDKGDDHPIVDSIDIVGDSILDPLVDNEDNAPMVVDSINDC